MSIVAELFARGSNNVRISNLCFPGVDRAMDYKSVGHPNQFQRQETVTFSSIPKQTKRNHFLWVCCLQGCGKSLPECETCNHAIGNCSIQEPPARWGDCDTNQCSPPLTRMQQGPPMTVGYGVPFVFPSVFFNPHSKSQTRVAYTYTNDCMDSATKKPPVHQSI